MSKDKVTKKMLDHIKYCLSGKTSIRNLFLFGQVGFYVVAALLVFIFYAISPIPIIGFSGVVFAFFFVAIYPVAFVISWWKSALLNAVKNLYLARSYIIIFLIIHACASIVVIVFSFGIYEAHHDIMNTIKNNGFKRVDYNHFNKEKVLSEYCYKRCWNFATASMGCEQHCVDERQQISDQEVCTESCLLEHQFQPSFWNHMLCKNRCNND